MLEACLMLLRSVAVRGACLCVLASGFSAMSACSGGGTERAYDGSEPVEKSPDSGTVDTSGCTQEELGFSFFATSLAAMQRESGSADGFGGDLGGLAGADALCQSIAEYSTPCAARRQWRAFLSTTSGPVHAKDRIGSGPWYDRVGRVVALTLTDLLNERPVGADPAIADDLPNEDGVPNHDPDGTGQVDNHDFLTGTNDQGELFDVDPAYTCQDWTSAEADGTPRCGHTWPAGGGGGGTWGGRGGGDVGGGMSNWMSALNEAGCAPADTMTSLIESGGPNERNPTVGSGGGYGGIYCFALEP
jgi:hypothetical protein